MDNWGAFFMLQMVGSIGTRKNALTEKRESTLGGVRTRRDIPKASISPRILLLMIKRQQATPHHSRRE